MARKRLVKQVANHGRIAQVYRNGEYDEFEVRFSINGEDCGSESDYFTNDKDDAIETAIHWTNEEN
jgi:hypothetical protein